MTRRLASAAAILLLAAGPALGGCPDPEGTEPFRLIGDGFFDTVDRSARPLFVVERIYPEIRLTTRVERLGGYFFVKGVEVNADTLIMRVDYAEDPLTFLPFQVGAEWRVEETRFLPNGDGTEIVATSMPTTRVVAATRIEIGECRYDGFIIETAPDPSLRQIFTREHFIPGIGTVAIEFTEEGQPQKGHRFDRITTDLDGGSEP